MGILLFQRMTITLVCGSQFINKPVRSGTIQIIMKIELIKNEQGQAVGYKMIAETAEDTPIIEMIRDLNFWGYGENTVEYKGRNCGEDDVTTELEWTLRYLKEEDRKKREDERILRRKRKD